MENKAGTGVPAGKYVNTPTSTLNRPISGQGYDDSTLSPTRPLTKSNAPSNYPPRENIDGNMGWMPKMNASENGSGICEGSDGKIPYFFFFFLLCFKDFFSFVSKIFLW